MLDILKEDEAAPQDLETDCFRRWVGHQHCVGRLSYLATRDMNEDLQGMRLFFVEKSFLNIQPEKWLRDAFRNTMHDDRL